MNKQHQNSKKLNSNFILSKPVSHLRLLLSNFIFKSSTNPVGSIPRLSLPPHHRTLVQRNTSPLTWIIITTSEFWQSVLHMTKSILLNGLVRACHSSAQNPLTALAIGVKVYRPYRMCLPTTTNNPPLYSHFRSLVPTHFTPVTLASSNMLEHSCPRAFALVFPQPRKLSPRFAKLLLLHFLHVSAQMSPYQKCIPWLLYKREYTLSSLPCFISLCWIYHCLIS